MFALVRDSLTNSKITVLIQSPSLQNNYLNKTKENKKVPFSLLHMYGPQSHIHSLVSPTKPKPEDNEIKNSVKRKQTLKPLNPIIPFYDPIPTGLMS